MLAPSYATARGEPGGKPGVPSQRAAPPATTSLPHRASTSGARALTSLAEDDEEESDDDLWGAEMPGAGKFGQAVHAYFHHHHHLHL